MSKGGFPCHVQAIDQNPPASGPAVPASCGIRTHLNAAHIAYGKPVQSPAVKALNHLNLCQDFKTFRRYTTATGFLTPFELSAELHRSLVSVAPHPAATPSVSLIMRNTC